MLNLALIPHLGLPEKITEMHDGKRLPLSLIKPKVVERKAAINRRDNWIVEMMSRPRQLSWRTSSSSPQAATFSVTAVAAGGSTAATKYPRIMAMLPCETELDLQPTTQEEKTREVFQRLGGKKFFFLFFFFLPDWQRWETACLGLDHVREHLLWIICRMVSLWKVFCWAGTEIWHKIVI